MIVILETMLRSKGIPRLVKNVKYFILASIGEIPQDLKFDGEKTKTIIG